MTKEKNNLPAILTPAKSGIGGAWDPADAISDVDLQNPRVKKILAALRDLHDLPLNWKKTKTAWQRIVALKYRVSPGTLHNWRQQYREKGIAGLRHTKPSKGSARDWSPEALEFMISLFAKREHRKISKKELYEILTIEAQRRGWRIGGYKSALWWFNKKWNPALEAYQRGGMRALDNILPPVLRDYSDLKPFEILCGDQHRFDFWVSDEETGEVFRPEGYLWQDLRTRIIYGAAVDKRYDSWLIGLALRLGVSCFGAFGSIYTDNGRPELSKFLMSILSNLHSLGMNWEKTSDTITDLTEEDLEDVQPYCVPQGMHKKAIVRNAKAKMIEGTFYRLEQIMTSHLRAPGYTKRLSDDTTWQDIDQEEATRLAKQGKLLTFREFVLLLYRAINFYNQEKPHRGVLREWVWKPKPAQATPFDCLRACYNEGWRPRMISNEAADLIFLDRAVRVVQKGMISLNNEYYTADALGAMHGQRVNIRFNPLLMDKVLVFKKDEFICVALPLEYSSMLDFDLASRKIAEKRERRKKFAEEFKRISSIAPDFRQYSTVPEAERVAALIGEDRKRRALENKEFNRPLSEQEINEHIAKMEAKQALPLKKRKPLPERPGFFLDRDSRFLWILEFLESGGELSGEDARFKDEYLKQQTPEQRDYFLFRLSFCEEA